MLLHTPLFDNHQSLISKQASAVTGNPAVDAPIFAAPLTVACWIGLCPLFEPRPCPHPVPAPELPATPNLNGDETERRDRQSRS